MLNLHSRKIDKKKIVDNIFDCGFIKFDASNLDFDILLNKPLFIDLMDMFRKDWNDVSRDFNDILSLMQNTMIICIILGVPEKDTYTEC